MAFLAPIGAFLAANAGTISAVSAAAAAIGTGAFTAASQYSAAKQEEKAYKQSAELQRAIGERNAALVDIEGEAARVALIRDRARRIGAARAQLGASGFDLSGSPLDLIADENAQVTRDLLYLDYNTRVARENALLGGAIATRNQLLDATGARQRSQSAYGSLLGGFASSLPDIADATYQTTPKYDDLSDLGDF